MFTYRIAHLSEHLKSNRKDFNSERSLVRLVGKRRSLLDYLMKRHHEVSSHRKRAWTKKINFRGLCAPFFLYIVSTYFRFQKLSPKG